MIRAFGEAALLVTTGDWRRAQALATSLRDDPLPGAIEAVPGLDTVLVELDPTAADPTAADPATVEAAVAARLAALSSPPGPAGRERAIPCAYGGEFGPDLGEVARLAGLSPEEVIARHVAAPHTVELLGFAPGFAYLGGLPDELAVTRLATPRTSTPPGSVAVAGAWSGIYPSDLPGGWRVIGRTPLTLFDPLRDPPAYLAPGDRVRFVAIDAGDWPGDLLEPRDW